MQPRRTVDVFVYGTLIDHPLDEGVVTLLQRHVVATQAASVAGRLYDLGPYPGARPAWRRGERVHGRLLTLTCPDHCLETLDRYENAHRRHPELGLYRREVVHAEPVDGGKRPAFIYWYNRPVNESRRVPDGRWRRVG